MSNSFTKDQISQLKEAFKLFDKDNDGFLHKHEMIALIEEMGSTSTRDSTIELIDQFDVDGNGKIEIDQFISIMAQKMTNITTDKEIQEAFKIFDLKADNYITFDQLKEILNKMGEKTTDDEIMNMIKEADYDGDSKISFDDFAKMMAR